MASHLFGGLADPLEDLMKGYQPSPQKSAHLTSEASGRRWGEGAGDGLGTRTLLTGTLLFKFLTCFESAADKSC